jgi:hypothetical protein
LTITLPDVAPAPARVLVACEGCRCAMSLPADRSPLPSHCYWCANGLTPDQVAADSYRFAVDGVA